MPTSSTPAASSIVRPILIALALTALAIVIWKLSDVVIAAFGGVVGAAALRALADPLARRTGLSSRLALAVVILAGVIVLGLGGWLFGSQVSEQVGELQRLLPQAGAKVKEAVQRSDVGRMLVDAAKHAAGDSKTLSGVGLAAGAVVVSVADIFLIFFLSVYFALDPAEYREGFLRLLPSPRRAQVRGALNDAGDALRRWLLAQLLAMVVVGLLVGVSLAVLGVPLAFLLGVLAAMLEFIPVAGPVLFTIPGVLVAFTKGPAMALYALMIYLVVQQLESNVLIPLLQRWAVRLAPVISLLSVIAGGLLFGVMGVVFATPLAVVVTALVKHLYVEDTLENGRRARRKEAKDQPPRGD